MLKWFKSDQRLMFSLAFQILEISNILNYIGSKDGIATIVIYITIFALLVRKGL